MKIHVRTDLKMLSKSWWARVATKSFWISPGNTCTHEWKLETKLYEYLAKGEEYADWAFGKLTVPDSNTCSPGTNFRLFGLGVSCTWINMVLILAGMKDFIKESKLNARNWLLREKEDPFRQIPILKMHPRIHSVSELLIQNGRMNNVWVGVEFNYLRME